LQISIRTFRFLVVTPLILSFFAFALGTLPFAQLPESAIEAKREHTKPIENFAIGMPLMIALVFLYLLALIGLLIFWNKARYLFLACFFFELLWMLFTNPHVSSGLEYALHSLGIFVFGLVVALSFSSNIAELFERKENISA
jgi:hypothetical protein